MNISFPFFRKKSLFMTETNSIASVNLVGNFGEFSAAGQRVMNRGILTIDIFIRYVFAFSENEWIRPWCYFADISPKLGLYRTDLRNCPIQRTNSDSPAGSYTAECFHKLKLTKRIQRHFRYKEVIQVNN